MNDPIFEFSGYYRFLSNFWPCTVHFDGEPYGSAEHAYQAAKTLDFNKRRLIQACATPGQAKRAGQRLPLRAEWDGIKVQVMYRIVRDKFTRNPELRKRLLETGDARLEEGNYWGDKFWGISPAKSGDGRNELGKILMAVRQEMAQLQGDSHG
jgi:ribA/ribD-fused uncharacterized protein